MAVVEFWTRCNGGLDSSHSRESGDKRLASGHVVQNLLMDVGIRERSKLTIRVVP